MLLEYSGTLILVSHDRAFLNNLVTSTLVLSGDGRAREFVGGYDDWQNQKDAEQETRAASEKARKTAPAPATKKQQASKKLSYKEQSELDQLPSKIEALEAEQVHLNTSLADPAFYQNNNAEVSRAVERLKAVENELQQIYRRWEELEK
jgi:ATP-binding cassette subfamily F protein uup